MYELAFHRVPYDSVVIYLFIFPLFCPYFPLSPNSLLNFTKQATDVRTLSDHGSFDCSLCLTAILYPPARRPVVADAPSDIPSEYFQLMEQCWFVLFCFVLFCFVLFCFILFYFILFCFVLFLFDFISFHFISFHSISFHFILFYFILFYFILFCFVFRFVLFFVLFCSAIFFRHADPKQRPVFPDIYTRLLNILVQPPSPFLSLFPSPFPFLSPAPFSHTQLPSSPERRKRGSYGLQPP